MRKLIVALSIAALIAALIYLGSSAVGFKRLAEAAASGRSSEVLARTDLRRLRKSLADQALIAYGRLNPRAPSSTALRDMLRANVEGNIADAIVARLITPETLTELLKSGSSGELQLPALTTFKASDALSRFRFVNPVTMGFRSTPDVEVLMRYADFQWKLAGLRISDTLADRLASQIMAKR